MKMPRMTSQQSLNRLISSYDGVIRRSKKEDQLSLMIDIDCLARCAGSTANHCRRCGVDRDCWIDCAGQEATNCIDGCFEIAALIAKG